MRRLRGRVRTIRQEPYRPSEAPASGALDSVVRAPLAFVERLPEETHGLGPQPAGRSLPRRGAPLPRREPYGGLTRGRPQDRRRVRRRRRRPALAQGAGQARLVGADLADGIWRHRLERHPALHLRPRMHRRRRAAHLRHGHPHGRTRDHEVRHARAEGQVPAQDRVGRHRVLPGLFRAGLGLRPRQPQDARRARRRRLRDQRHQDLDDRRARRRPHVLPGAHRDRGQAAGRHLLRADRFDERRPA